jgi:bifunctional enzyme CysN/CysC
MSSTPLKLVVAGHVDHGKSTLVGRLLHDTDSLPEGKIEELKAAAAQRGVPFEWSFTLDALQAERDQAVTIDAARCQLRLAGRDALLIDAPGHREFLAKMMTGASTADAALLVVDAAQGVQAETRRHAHLFHLLGIRTVVVALNKMDLVDFAESRFRERGAEIATALAALDLTSKAVVPVAAADGDNVAHRSSRMPWYQGPPLAEALAALPAALPPIEQPLRLPIQDVYRIDQRRLYAGRIESGRIAVGDEVLFSPSNKTARVTGIELWPAQLTEATAGRAVAITLDRPLFIERGEVASHLDARPVLAQHFRATLVWLGARPPRLGASYRLDLNTARAPVMIERIDRVLDTAQSVERQDKRLERDGIAEAMLKGPRLLALDDASRLPRSGRFVLREDGEVVAGGLVNLDGIADQRPAPAAAALTPVTHRVTREARTRRAGHRGGVLWFTGFSGAGKSTLAMAVEEHLFRKGYAVYVLDGDNVRGGLNADLGFRPADRVENIRRIGEVAALFADAGFICITAFISPYAADRARARAAAGAAFHEIHLNVDIATCERRDPKGLYRRARAGELAEFTGIAAPYEPPTAPELTVDTGALSIEASVELIVQHVERYFVLDPLAG